MTDNFLYEGKAKVLYDNKDGNVTIYYKDDATAFNGVKKDVLSDKGIYNNKISEIIYKYLEENGIKTHFVERISEREQICKKVDIIPLEVIVRNLSAGSMAKRLGLKEGTKLSIPVFELSYKDDDLGDPMINDDYAVALNIVSKDELNTIKETAYKINDILSKLFIEKNIILVDFKIEFGRTENGEIILADEISPDTCRLWDKDTNEKFDKDRFRRDLKDVMKGYTVIYDLLK